MRASWCDYYYRRRGWIWPFHVINPWRFNCHVNGFSWNDFSTGGYAVVRLIGDHVLRIMANWFTIHADPSPFIRAMDFPPRSPRHIISFLSSLMEEFLISLFSFFFFLFYRLVWNGSLKRRGVGRETLLGLMKVLGFCNSLLEIFFFEKVWGSSIGKKLRLVRKFARCNLLLEVVLFVRKI